uniref:Alpha glucosidase 2 n=1 Tax=Callorhinchus milii TaxID=7868 RepID=A0A4W3J130_CALMI
MSRQVELLWEGAVSPVQREAGKPEIVPRWRRWLLLLLALALLLGFAQLLPGTLTLRGPEWQPRQLARESWQGGDGGGRGPVGLAGCGSVPEARQFDCYPERDTVVTRKLCQARGCCFVQVLRRLSGVPWCFYPPTFPTYTLTNLSQTPLGETGVLTRSQKSYYPNDVLNLQLDVTFETNTRLHIKIRDSRSHRYEVPIEVPPPAHRAPAPTYTVQYSPKPFGLIVTRKSTGAVLYGLLNTTLAPLLFADQFLQISTSLPSPYIYGLGEHQAGFLHTVQWNTLTFWARDCPPRDFVNLYGVHPFYLSIEPNGTSHGVFLLNSNAMDVVLQPVPALTWRTIGGVLDFYIFMGPDPNSVIQQYLEVVGRPAMPPAWGLGFHLCRWGYRTSNRTWQVVKEMRDAGIPQDVQWNDIDYMDRYLDFTFDARTFDSLPDLVKDLHDHRQRYVMILDPGISSTQTPGTYWPYDEGLKRGVFINNATGNPLIGQVWPGLTAFPDFSDPKTQGWWYENLLRYHQAVPFDGVWIDMNEPSNFLDGSTEGCPSDRFENPPYVPGVLGGQLRSKTICASAKQSVSLHYNVHSLYGLMEAKATASALIKILNKRPFVISRSTFPSQGKYSGHWLGDNRSQWKDMYYSIPGILNFNMFGIPLVGSDICGFGDTTTEEMCVRWTQLGAFYPFSRNHNMLGTKAQQPTAFSTSAQAAMRTALRTRYSLFPFLYTLFHRAHVLGQTVARPLLFEFPEDVNTFSVDRQFLWGRSLLITPVLEPGADSVTGYFPKGLWFDFYTVSSCQPGRQTLSRGTALSSSGEHRKLAAPLDIINLHIREGSIIPAQEPNTTIWDSSSNPLYLMVGLTPQGTAQGDIFWDDGESLDTYESGNYTYVTFSVAEVMQVNPLNPCLSPRSDSLYIPVVVRPLASQVRGPRFDSRPGQNLIGTRLLVDWRITLYKRCLFDPL